MNRSGSTGGVSSSAWGSQRRGQGRRQQLSRAVGPCFAIALLCFLLALPRGGVRPAGTAARRAGPHGAGQQQPLSEPVSGSLDAALTGGRAGGDSESRGAAVEAVAAESVGAAVVPGADADALDAVAERMTKEISALSRAWRAGGAEVPADRVAALRRACGDALAARYGSAETLLVSMTVQLPQSMLRGDRDDEAEVKDAQTEGGYTLWLRTAPLAWLPHAVWTFLHNAVGADEIFFHRRAGHVLQAFIRPRRTDGLAFQEYDERFPHEENTLGFAGRPGGPDFYISTRNNTRDHGPGSQGSATEADGIFGKLILGEESSRAHQTALALARLKEQPGGGKMGFVNEKENWIAVSNVRVVAET